jgi:hypothetical protein
MARKAHDGRHRSSKWRVTAGGRILLTALAVLIILAIVAPSTPIYAGLALLILIWASALNMSFPSRSIGRSARAARDFDRQLRESDGRQQRPR